MLLKDTFFHSMEQYISCGGTFAEATRQQTKFDGEIYEINT